MSQNRKKDYKTVRIDLRVTPKEKDFIWKKARSLHFENLSEYLRNMAVHGRAIDLGGTIMLQIYSLLSGIKNSLDSGEILSENEKDCIQKELVLIRRLLTEIVRRLDREGL